MLLANFYGIWGIRNTKQILEGVYNNQTFGDQIGGNAI